MLLSYRKKFLFIHIYKVAGTSVIKSLKRSAFNPYELLRYKIASQLNLRNPYCPILDHAKAREIKDEIGAEIYDRLFTFAFVRNPWDWQVSQYNFIRQNEKHFQHDLLKEMTFDEYIDWRVGQSYELQKDYIVDEKGRIIVDFIGKFENLNSDFAEVCSKIDLNAQLPHLNPSKRSRNYQDYYDDRTKNLIARHFEEDISTFEYSF